MRNKILNIVGIIGCMLIIPVLIVTLTMTIQRFVEPNVPPGFMGYVPLAVSSGSMSPEFDTNDMIIINKNADLSNLEISDVITYWSDDVLVTHRIIDIEVNDSGESIYVTQGDANNTPDSLRVSVDMILGVYVNRIPNVGEISFFLSTTSGKLVCIMMFAVIILAVCIIWVYRKNMKLQRQLHGFAVKVDAN